LAWNAKRIAGNVPGNTRFRAIAVTKSKVRIFAGRLRIAIPTKANLNAVCQSCFVIGPDRVAKQKRQHPSALN
jgi:hypothetical protein